MAKNKVLSITEIEDGVKRLLSKNNGDDFITQFLALYDIPKTSITRAKSKFDKGGPFIIKNKLHYEEIEGDVVIAIDAIAQSIKEQKSKPRYILVNDYSDIAAIDTKTHETLNISIEELPANADFFLAWNGIEKADYQAENPADRKAAERFAKLYDVVAKDNPDANEHAFNLFLIRVLFLLFAEDTGIMNKGSFTNVLKTRTLEDGSNFNEVIKELFAILDINELARSGKDEWLLEFPYVNGKLFGEPHVDLNFSKVSRELLIEAGELLNWNEINPDILGAMIQSVASAEDRHVAGMHYTSVPNIMKVIKPLFLDDLTDAFEALKIRSEENELKDITEKTRNDNRKSIINELGSLLTRISKIKFLDPASGSGNFLIIAYKEIRRLEIKILQLLGDLQDNDSMPLSVIHLGNFNGIELDDFAHEVARLSLWIAEHQMNKELEEAIPGTIAELLPLKDAGNIVCANSLRVDWDEVTHFSKEDEIYIMGNPPYIGAKKQTPSQKEELEYALDGNKKYKKIDYIAGWFYKGANITQNEDGIYEIERPDGKELLVADLVNEDGREKVSAYLASITDDIRDLDKLDIIIALGMAKEGFDWPFAEYALTIGYRNSLTEVIQIIGRVTRDSPNKTHAQFTNLIAQPDAQDDEVLFAVNSIMKAISASLLMEQVLAPVYKFKPKDDKPDKPGNLSIRGLKPADTTERTKKIIENDMEDLKSSILQSQDIQNAIVSGAEAKMINKTLIPRVIIERYPDLTNEELETVRQHIVADINIAAGQTTTSEDGSREIIKMADRFINIDELNIDLIDQVNPFQRAYEVISRDIDAPTLRFIQDYLSSNKYDFTDEQLVAAYQAAKKFRAENGRNPDRNSKDDGEKYLAFALLRLAEIKREREAAEEDGE